MKDSNDIFKEFRKKHPKGIYSTYVKCINENNSWGFIKGQFYKATHGDHLVIDGKDIMAIEWLVYTIYNDNGTSIHLHDTYYWNCTSPFYDNFREATEDEVTKLRNMDKFDL